MADVGCGSGYGCQLLRANGAAKVYGSDISKQSIEFAKRRFSEYAEFSIQGITGLHQFKIHYFDVVVSSEVLEHIKEYGLEDKAMKELQRITKSSGLVIVGTPNSELLGKHGFSFDEIHELCKKNFRSSCIFENALVPFEQKEKQNWERRKSEGRHGVIVTECINFAETVLPAGCEPEVKQGIPAGSFTFDGVTINTELLHNTHSWVVIAINESEGAMA